MMPGQNYTEAELRAAARAAATKHGIDPRLFEAQIAQESDNYAPSVVQGKRKSSAGAIGIAQFMPRTAKSLGVDPLDPLAALDASAAYMASLTKKFGNDENLGRLAYNWGEGNVAKYLKNPGAKKIPKEAQDYNTLIAKRAGVAAPVLALNGAKPTPQQIEAAAAPAAPAPTAKATPQQQLQALDTAGLEIAAGLPPEPTPAPQDPVQQAAAPSPSGDADPLAWLGALQGPGGFAPGIGTDSAGDFLEKLQDAASKSQDTALAAMFSDTPGLEKQDGPALPSAVDRFLDKLLT